MNIVRIYVGLDYHDDAIQVCILNEQGEELLNKSRPNDVEAVAETIFGFGSVVECAIEACCGAADFAEALSEYHANIDVRLAHPGYAARLKQSPDKSDYSDAQLLADLIRVNYVPEVWLAPTKIRELRQVSRYRSQLKRNRKDIKLQIRATLREQRVKPPAKAWSKPWKEWLQETSELRAATRWVLDDQFARLAEVENRIACVERQLAEMTQDDPVVAKLLEQPGVGPITAITLRAEIGHFDRFHKGKQLARYCGVTPRNASSGKRHADAGLIRAGNSELRSLLMEAAHRLVQHDPRWKELKHKLRQSKPGSVAVAAVANRWIRWLYYQVVTVETDQLQVAA